MKWVLILIISVLPPKVMDSYEIKSQCDKALRYEQHLAPQSKFKCILKKDLVKLDRVLRDK